MGGPIAYLKAHPERSFNVERSDEFLARLGHSRDNPICVFVAFYQDIKKEKRAMSACVPQEYFAKSGQYLKQLGGEIDEIESEVVFNQEADLFKRTQLDLRCTEHLRVAIPTSCTQQRSKCRPPPQSESLGK